MWTKYSSCQDSMRLKSEKLIEFGKNAYITGLVGQDEAVTASCQGYKTRQE